LRNSDYCFSKKSCDNRDNHIQQEAISVFRENLKTPFRINPRLVSWFGPIIAKTKVWALLGFLCVFPQFNCDIFQEARETISKVLKNKLIFFSFNTGRSNLGVFFLPGEDNSNLSTEKKLLNFDGQKFLVKIIKYGIFSRSGFL
jgi:hypothetical protein